MSLRTKLLVVFIVGSLAPALLVGVLLYRNGVSAVEKMLREDVETKTARIAGDVEATLRERELDLNYLAQTSAVRSYARNGGAQLPAAASGESAANLPDAGATAAISDFISRNRDYYFSITLLSAPLAGEPESRLPVRFEPPAGNGQAPLVKRGELLPGQLPFDERVWTTTEQKTLRSNVKRGSTGTPSIVYTLPVFAADIARAQPLFALVAELKPDSLLQHAGSELNVATTTSPALTRESGAGNPSRLLLMLDGSGQVVYHTNHALKYQAAGVAMPYFDAFTREMAARRSGTNYYTAPADGTRWLGSYQPVKESDLSVAVAGNYTGAVASLNRSAALYLALAVLLACAAMLLHFAMISRAARRIRRVTEAAAAIADGDLNQHLEGGEQGEIDMLTKGFNRMSDRLREHIAREAETRQFQSFVRLSAMLTHDLKNSITGLSILVSNMERQFHRAEFREDAISSLKQATEKLSGIVARLSEPVKSLSGEFRRTPRPDDLIPVIRRVLETTATPSAAFYDIQTELPDELYAPIDTERIERVVENLIVNAFEAMGTRGGRLTVAAGDESAGLVFFSVEDTGPGITDEFIRTRLFRAFATTKRRGIGLGLYTCREIVEAHGGRLEVKSKVGSGTRFRVVLPSIPLSPAHARQTEKFSPEE